MLISYMHFSAIIQALCLLTLKISLTLDIITSVILIVALRYSSQLSVSRVNQHLRLSIMDNGLTNLKRDYVIIYYRLCLYNYNILLTRKGRSKYFQRFSWRIDDRKINRSSVTLCKNVVANQRQQAYDWRTLLYLIGTLIENVMVK